MGRLPASMIAISLAIAAGLALVACGGGDDADLLPGSTAGEINSNLDRVERLADQGDCVGAADATEQVSAQVEGLEGVDRKLKQALAAGTARLREVVAGCEEASSEEEEEIEPVVEPEEEAPETTEESAEPKREKPDDEQREKEKQTEGEGESESEQGTESPSLPPQAEGKAKGHEKEGSESPPAESGGGEPPAGGVSPSTPVGGG